MSKLINKNTILLKYSLYMLKLLKLFDVFKVYV